MEYEGALPRAYRLSPDEERGPCVQSQPRCVFIEVTNRCNLACATCVRAFTAYEPPRELTMEEFEAISAQFPAMERAVLHGLGEPLLNRHLPAMIRHLKGRGITVLFNSNGTLLTAEWQEALALSGLDELRISIDTPDAERYARIRGKPLLHRVIDNVRGLIATKARLGVETPRLSFWVVGTKENLEQLPDLIRLASSIGVPEVYVQRLTFAVEAVERYGAALPKQALFGRLTESEASIIDQCQQLSRALGIGFQASGATDPANSLRAARDRDQRPWSSCRRPWTTAYITVDGNALPCCIAHWADTNYARMILGNIWHKDFNDIWNDKPYQAWRRALLSDTPNEACSGCGVHWSI
jgi:radical SAM protein with 4Fe4S-binding SPASM domain